MSDLSMIFIIGFAAFIFVMLFAGWATFLFSGTRIRESLAIRPAGFQEENDDTHIAKVSHTASEQVHIDRIR